MKHNFIIEAYNLICGNPPYVMEKPKKKIIEEQKTQPEIFTTPKELVDYIMKDKKKTTYFLPGDYIDW